MAGENYDVPIDIRFKVEGAEQATQKIEDAGEAMQDASKKGDDLSESTERVSSGASKLRNVAAAAGAIGVATAAAAKTFGQVRDALESIDTTQLRAVDSEMADNIDSAKKWATALEDPIGLLLQLVTGETVESAFDGLNDQLQRNADMTSQAVDRFIAKSAIQVDQIKRLSDDLKAANALADAKADTAATIRAGSNAERIRNGEAPEDVAAEEAKIQAAEKIAKIERDQEESRVGLQEKYNSSIQHAQAAEAGKAAGGRIDAAQNKFNAAEDALKTDMFTSQTVLEERRDAARRELEEVTQRDSVAALAVKENEEKAAAARKEFEEQKKQIANSDAIANERKANIRAGASNTVEESQAKKTEREQSEKAKADAAAAKVAADALRESQRAELEAKRTKLAGTAAGNEAKIKAGGGKQGGLQDIGKDIGDADSAAEIAAIGEQVKAKQGELGAATVDALKQMLAGQAAMIKEIEILKQKIRNN